MANISSSYVVLKQERLFFPFYRQGSEPEEGKSFCLKCLSELVEGTPRQYPSQAMEQGCLNSTLTSRCQDSIATLSAHLWNLITLKLVFLYAFSSHKPAWLVSRIKSLESASEGSKRPGEMQQITSQHFAWCLRRRGASGNSVEVVTDGSKLSQGLAQGLSPSHRG